MAASFPEAMDGKKELQFSRGIHRLLSEKNKKIHFSLALHGATRWSDAASPWWDPINAVLTAPA